MLARKRRNTILRENAITLEEGKRNKVMSQKALEANRNNAKKSTGPKTKQRNPLALPSNYKHGILASVPVLPGIESQEEYDKLVLELKTDLRPSGAIETALVEKLANIMWKQKRLQLYEKKHIENEIIDIQEEVTKNWISWYEYWYKNPESTIDANTSKLQRLKYDLADGETGVRAYKILETMKENDSFDDFNYPFVIVNTILDFEYCQRKQDGQEIPDTSSDLFKPEAVIDNWNDEQKIPLKDLRKVIEEMARQFGKTSEELMENGKELAQGFYEECKFELAKFEQEIEAKSCEKLFEGYISEKVMRHESHLNRLFLQTLHELQRMQGMRIGISNPPEAIDITGVEF
jgi:phage antirepressor YoqD-like protein/predicted RNase H-like HicB family nuclease